MLFDIAKLALDRKEPDYSNYNTNSQYHARIHAMSYSNPSKRLAPS